VWKNKLQDLVAVSGNSLLLSGKINLTISFIANYEGLSAISHGDFPNIMNTHPE